MKIHGDVLFRDADGLHTVADLDNDTTTISQLKDTNIDESIRKQGSTLVWNHAAQSWEIDVDGLTKLPQFDIIAPTHGQTLVFNDYMQKWINVDADRMALSLTDCHNRGMTGLQKISWGSQERIMRVDTYNGKSYVEILYSFDPSFSAPWDLGWIDNDTYFLREYNTSSDGLNYSASVQISGGPSASSGGVLLTNEPLTNVLFTRKTSIHNGIDPTVILETSHLAGGDRQLFCDYFSGQSAGFELLDSFGWAGGAGLYDTHLSYRAGSFRGGEWLIQDSITGGSTGAPRWGYRKSGTDNQAAAVGGQPITATNMLSVWVTNMPI